MIELETSVRSVKDILMEKENIDSVTELLGEMREYEKRVPGKFFTLKLIMFADESGWLIATSVSNEDEELLEFESIKEARDFLRR